MSAIAEPDTPLPAGAAATGGRPGPGARAGGRFFDRHGRRVSRSAWRRLSEFPGYTLVALDTMLVRERPVQVHTFWLGIADPRHPLIFRTVTSGLHPRNPTWGWATEEAARTGHQVVCAWAREHAAPPAG